MKKIFITGGAGYVGAVMVPHLLEQGFEVTVFNRTTEKAERWCDEYGGTWTTSASDAAVGAEAVFTCLGDDPDLREVVLEQGVIDVMSPGSLFVDHTTASADTEWFHIRRCVRTFH